MRRGFTEGKEAKGKRRRLDHNNEILTMFMEGEGENTLFVFYQVRFHLMLQRQLMSLLFIILFALVEAYSVCYIQTMCIFV